MPISEHDPDESPPGRNPGEMAIPERHRQENPPGHNPEEIGIPERHRQENPPGHNPEEIDIPERHRQENPPGHNPEEMDILERHRQENPPGHNPEEIDILERHRQENLLLEQNLQDESIREDNLENTTPEDSSNRTQQQQRESTLTRLTFSFIYLFFMTAVIISSNLVAINMVNHKLDSFISYIKSGDFDEFTQLGNKHAVSIGQDVDVRTSLILPQVNAFTEEELLHQKDIERADESLLSNSPYSFSRYKQLLTKIPNSFRVNYGMARAYERDAHTTDGAPSMESLLHASIYYLKAYKLIHDGVKPGVNDTIAQRIIDIFEDTRNLDVALKTYVDLLKDHPDAAYFHHRLAVSFAEMTSDRFPHTAKKYEKLLKEEPIDGEALINYGYLMYTHGLWRKAVEYLSKAIKTGIHVKHKGKFYEALGTSLERLGRKHDATEYYEEAVENGVFPSIYQRSTDNLYYLTDIPWWSMEQLESSTHSKDYLTFYEKLKSKWTELRREVLDSHAAYRRYFHNVERHSAVGNVREAYIFKRGSATRAYRAFPEAFHLFQAFKWTSNCEKCDVKYLQMQEGHIWPKCDTTNNIITTHLGLSVPRDVYIRVHNETRTWTEGEVLIFSGSFEHEIWNNGSGTLTILSFDMWHPELITSEMQM